MNQQEPDFTAPPDAHFHHAFTHLPDWVLKASPATRNALKSAPLRMPDWHTRATRQQHQSLKRVSEQYWTRRNRLDARMSRLINARDFAESLLRAALKSRFDLELNVKTTFLRLYIPQNIPWLPIKSGAARTWTVSLLDAALHNFEDAETKADAYESASTFTTRPSPSGQFDTLPAIKRRLTVQDFTRLCRELDIGGQYEAYLKNYLGVTQPVAAAVLRSEVISTHKAALRVELERADVRGDLPIKLMLDLCEGPAGTPRPAQAMQGHDLTIMSSSLTGIVVFASELERSRQASPIIVYIPDDPEHPLKRYPDSLTFIKDLTRKLRAPAYQVFFSRFVDHHERGYFFADLSRRLTSVTWHERPYGDPRPVWRDTPVDKPNLQFSLTPINTDLWTHLYQQQVNKILNDARTQAVSTASADRAARWARWDAFGKVATSLLEVATFVALPFVPFLGEWMLAYMAWQLLDDTFEGIVDWAEGLKTEAFGHVMSLVESVVQLGTFAVGGALAAGTLSRLMSSEAVALFCGLKPVETVGGKIRYWKPDLAPYEYPADLPKTARPDQLGLYHQDGKTLLRLEDRLHAVKLNSQTGGFELEHPDRADAYGVLLRHNHHGAWQTLLDQPLTWDRETVMRRLGHSVESFNSVEREQILRISGFHDNVLRESHVENQRPPSLLTDTIKRYTLNRDIQALAEQPSHPDHSQALAQPLSLFESRYRELEKTADRQVLLLQGEVRGLPTDIAQELVDNCSGTELMQLHEGRVPQRLKNVAAKAMEAVRVARAYEGFFFDSMDTADTHRLALHSLESMPGWSARLRIEIREFSETGSLRDHIGSSDAPLLKTLINADDGTYQVYGDGQPCVDFYHALLQALPETERTALGFSAEDAETLKQRLAEHAITQTQLRTLFAKKPHRKPFYDPTTMRLPGGAEGYRRSHTATPTLADRVREVYPGLTAEELRSVVSDLQRHPHGPRAELSRLARELEQLHEDLGRWVNEAPTLHPETGLALSEPARRGLQHNRRLLAQQIQRSWRRQTERDFDVPQDAERYVLRFAEPVPGDLPNLTADFSHVSLLALEGAREGNYAMQGVPGFLQQFPGLRRLELRRFALNSLPDAIGQMAHLETLVLSGCAINLDAIAWSKLSSMKKLRVLDLHQNPVQSVPQIDSMPELIHLDLSHTGLTGIPHGALQSTRLNMLLLMNNNITELPAELFESPVYEKRGVHLADNPINEASRDLIKQYYFETSFDLDVSAPDADVQRVQALYPTLEFQQASDFVYELPGTLAEGRTELTKLEAELSQLSDDLVTWTTDVPARHPLTGEPFTDAQLLIEHTNRDGFRQALERCWRHESELDDFNESLEPMFELRIVEPVNGELPNLSADFGHVSTLEMRSVNGATRIGRFLQAFPNLKTLRLQEIHLGDVPEAVFKMGQLRSLSLTHCRVTLSAESANALAGMEHLNYLDLGYNPLGHTPDLRQMPDLSTVLLNDTGITDIPPGLLQLEQLDWADLSTNAITEIPSDLMELPMETAANNTLRGNPFSAQSLESLINYYERTRLDFGVEEVINQGEMDISTSEGSEVEE
ncbi:dermonecrotic toxin domain-containing protein [Pseudomonas sp. PB3P13]